MQATIYQGPGEVGIEDVPEPNIEDPTDAIVRITHTTISGSDLWFYRGQLPNYPEGTAVGHEPMGIVEAVGDEVRSVRRGDRVFAPFTTSCGKCEFCRKGLQPLCVDGSWWGGEQSGAQSEKIRVPLADGTLIRVPDRHADDDAALESILLLTDVMCTGHHAAISAGVEASSTAVVVGDGAVGLCSVLAAKRLGAERIIAMGHHPDRLSIAAEFGATEVVSARGDEAINEVREQTYGGANHVLECVGSDSSMKTAAEIARPGGTVGYVGSVMGIETTEFLDPLFNKGLDLRGGVSPVRSYVDELMPDVLQGTLDPSPILTKSVDLEDIAEGYEMMDEREAVKVLVKSN